MTEEQFFRVSDPGEACELLARFKSRARVIAGGTDLMVWMNQREVSPEVLIYIGESGLDYVRSEGDNLIIGATTPFSDIMRSALVQEKAPLLAEAISHVGSPAIRNMGTMGGNLASASPAADSATALLALGASLRLISKRGERVAECNGFFTGPDQTLLKPDELIREIIVPVQPKGWKWGYRKLGRRKAQSLSVVSVAICCQQEGGKCSKIRIALGAVAPMPMLATKAAALLKGKAADGALIDKAAKTAADETHPIDDVRGSAWYRRKAVEALVKKLLKQILG